MSVKVLDSSQLKVHMKEREIVVEFDSMESIRNLGPNTETGELRPHGDTQCDCFDLGFDVVHTPFRLKIISLRRCYELLDIYIACDPDTFNAKCVVTGKLPIDSLPIQAYHDTTDNYPGWKYLTTVPYCIHNLKLFINISGVKDEISALPHSTLSLSDYLSQLLIDGTYSDVTVTSEDGATIKAHRCILAKRCEVFRAALEHNETTDTITTHLNEGTLRQIMTYIYTDKTPKRGDFTPDLFMAADYYQLSDLKNVCLRAFHSQLTVENAIATLELAERHSLGALLTITLKFIKKNFNSIENTEDWINLTSPTILKMVCKYSSLNI